MLVHLKCSAIHFGYFVEYWTWTNTFLYGTAAQNLMYSSTSRVFHNTSRVLFWTLYMYQSPIKCVILHSNAFPLYLKWPHLWNTWQLTENTTLHHAGPVCGMNQRLHLLVILVVRSCNEPAIESVTAYVQHGVFL